MTVGIKTKSLETAKSIPASTRYSAGAVCSSLAPPRPHSTFAQSGGVGRGLIPCGMYSSHSFITCSQHRNRSTNGYHGEQHERLQLFSLPLKSLRKKFPDPATGGKPLAVCQSLFEEELAGWSHSKGCGQQLDVQVETSDEWHSSGVGIGSCAV